MFSFTKALCLLAYVSSTIVMTINAAPLAGRDLEERTVYDPPITNPDAGSVWHVGEKKTVTWDTSILPEESHAENPKGKLILGYLEGDDINEHLMLDSPLAQNFALWDGKATVTVPDVPDRDGYIVVLMGSSGNTSQKFKIRDTVTVGGKGGVASSTSATLTQPIPISGTQITGAVSTATAAASSAASEATGATSVTSVLSSEASSASSAISELTSSASSVLSSAVSSASAAASSASSAAASATAAAASAPNAGATHGPVLWSTACAAIFMTMLATLL